jgi:hypothetical protein
MHSADLVDRFTYHEPDANQPERYRAIRSNALTLAALINENVPESREKSLAITRLEETVMWANAGIARHG